MWIEWSISAAPENQPTYEQQRFEQDEEREIVASCNGNTNVEVGHNKSAAHAIIRHYHHRVRGYRSAVAASLSSLLSPPGHKHVLFIVLLKYRH